MAKFNILEVHRTDDNTNTYNTEPVTVAELKTYLQIEGTAYDGPLEIFITAARQKIENYCNVSLVPKSLVVLAELTSNYKPVSLPFGPIDSVTSIEWQPDCGCGDWEVLASDEDFFTLGNNVFKIMKHGLIKATYTTEADDRSVWKQAIKAQAAYSFNNRDSDRRDAIAPEVEMLVSSLTQTGY